MVRDIIIILVLILVNGFFAGAEIALISVRPTTLKEKADEGSKRAKTALEMSENPTKLLATIQVAITLVGFGASAVATATLADPLAKWLSSFGLSWLTPIAMGFSIVLVTIAISYVTLILGELVPKRLGMARSESFALFVAGPLRIVEKIASPVVWLLTKSTNLVASLIGIKADETGTAISEEEIKLLVSEQSSLQDEEKRLIHEIFEVGDTVAREIMIPRVDMMLIEDTESVSKAVDIMHGTGYSRLPIFHEDHDKVVGIAILKDLLVPVIEGKGEDLVVDFARAPVFVPESKSILPLLTEMQESRQQMVIVVDEYGGTAGIVTTEDIIEEIVGEIEDEFDPDHKYITKLSDNEYLLDGRLPIEDAQELGLPLEEAEDYDTVAGWLLSELGKVPANGETFDYEGVSFTIQAMRRRRISRVKVVINQTPEVEAKEAEEENDRGEKTS